MWRGEIRLVDLGPVLGSEAAKVRPVVIVSNDGANAAAARGGRGVVTVVPITSNTTRVLPFQVLLPAAGCGLRRDSKAQAEQVRSVAVARIGWRVGRLPVDVLRRLDDALRLHLDLQDRRDLQDAPGCALRTPHPDVGRASGAVSFVPARRDPRRLLAGRVAVAR